MRIGIEGQRLFRENKHGMDVVALEIIKNLQRIDTHNDYFIFVKDGKDDSWFKSTPNFHIIRLRKAAYHIWEQIILPRAVNRYQIDILHCTSNTAPMFLKVPLVLTLHDIIYLENFKFVSYKSTLYQLVGNFYRRWVVPRILKIASKIITVSNTERAIIQQKCPELQEKIVVVYNSYSDHFDELDPRTELRIKEKYNLPDKYIFCLGNTNPKKNLSNTLKAYYLYLETSEEKLPLVLADYSPGDLFLLLNSNNSGFKEYLQFIGYVRNEDIPTIYKNAELFIYPSIRESFGIPIIESMKMGTCVITSNISCMPEIAGKSAYFVDPFDPKSIAKAISVVLDNPRVKSSLQERGLQRVKKYSWLQSAKEVLKIYEEIYEASLKK